MDCDSKLAEIGDPQVDKSHYFKNSYNSKGRFSSYWHQVDEIRSFADGDILEVGPGNHFVADYLQKRRYSVTTVDIDPNLDVDVVASVTDMPFEDNSFSVGACFEVLEHMPFSEAVEGLRELRRVSRDYVIVSVPDREHALWGRMRLPFVGEIEWFFSCPRLIPLEKPQVEDEHFWEIGIKKFELKKVKKSIKKVGFDIVNTYRPIEMDSHRFFILE